MNNFNCVIVILGMRVDRLFIAVELVLMELRRLVMVVVTRHLSLQLEDLR